MRALLVLAFALAATSASAQGGFAFIGTGGGAIPDGQNATPEASPGTPVAISFNVVGVTGPITSIALVIDINHTYVGDLNVALYAPGGSPSVPVFWRVGAASSTDLGFPADLNGVYTFSDLTGTANFWNAAQTAGAGVIPAGGSDYLAETPGGQAGGGTSQQMSPTFSGMSSAQINGTWMLIVQDVTLGDTGSLNGASLIIGTSGGGRGGDDGGSDDGSCSTGTGSPGTLWLLLAAAGSIAAIRCIARRPGSMGRALIRVAPVVFLCVAIMGLSGCQSTRSGQARQMDSAVSAQSDQAVLEDRDIMIFETYSTTFDFSLSKARTVRVEVRNAAGQDKTFDVILAQRDILTEFELPEWTEAASTNYVNSNWLAPGDYRVQVRRAKGSPGYNNLVRLRVVTQP